MKVSFFYLTNRFSFGRRTQLKKFLLTIFKKERCSLKDLNVIFCSDEYLLNVNKEFLKHDFYTDIVTFNLAAEGEPISGEIYISVDRVKENSGILHTPFKRELHRVIIHGVLHLCGYMDKTGRQIQEMRATEDNYLDLYFNSST